MPTDPKITYANFGIGRPALGRHPNDGWQMADLYPMGEPARIAMRGLIRAICPPSPAPQLPDLEERVEHEIRQLMRYMPALLAFGLRLGIRFLDWAPRIFFMNAKKLHALEPARARDVLDRVYTSAIPGLRDLVWAVRGLVLATFFDQDEVHKALNYAPIAWMNARIDLRDKLTAGKPWDSSDLIPQYDPQQPVRGAK